jgi:hypothetical protein
MSRADSKQARMVSYVSPYSSIQAASAAAYSSEVAEAFEHRTAS